MISMHQYLSYNMLDYIHIDYIFSLILKCHFGIFKKCFVFNIRGPLWSMDVFDHAPSLMQFVTIDDLYRLMSCITFK